MKTFRAAVELSEEELEALQLAHKHVRVHMAQEYPWIVRDNAMIAIGKVVAAAQELPSGSENEVPP